MSGRSDRKFWTHAMMPGWDNLQSQARAAVVGFHESRLGYELRRAHPSLEFEDVCRVQGRAALREYLATLPDPAKANEIEVDWLIDWVLKLHAEVVQKRVH
jgi:hypothetical protein